MGVNGAPKPPGYKLSSKYLHLSLSLGKTKKFIQVWKYKSKWRIFYFGVNNPFNHTSHYFNINLIGPSMILKEYSAVAVVKCASDWQINCIYISVVFYCVDISVNILICTFSWTTLFKDCPRDSGCCFKSCCTRECHFTQFTKLFVIIITLYMSQIIVVVHDPIGWKVVYLPFRTTFVFLSLCLAIY